MTAASLVPSPTPTTDPLLAPLGSRLEPTRNSASFPGHRKQALHACICLCCLQLCSLVFTLHTSAAIPICGKLCRTAVYMTRLTRLVQGVASSHLYGVCHCDARVHSGPSTQSYLLGEEEVFAFRRVESRLKEMMTEEYLQLQHLLFTTTEVTISLQ